MEHKGWGILLIMVSYWIGMHQSHASELNAEVRYQRAVAKVAVQPFQKAGPMIKVLTPASITVMGQGGAEEKKKGLSAFFSCNTDIPQDVTGVACLLAEGSKEADHFKTFDMLAADHYVGHVTFDKLIPGQNYILQIGYIDANLSHNLNATQVNWFHSHALKFTMGPASMSEEFSILVGSCRRIGLVTPWMEKGDIIFWAMQQNIDKHKTLGKKTHSIAFIGDQIYADAAGKWWFAAKTDEDYAKLYQKAFSQTHFHHLTSNFDGPVLMIRDDHEGWNDANAENAAQRPAQHQAAHKNYTLFQRPWGKETPHYWYTSSNGVDMFFTDTRSERYPSQKQIISPEQMDALKAWLSDVDKKDRIKIVVTSVPILLLQTDDSWGGYPAQQMELLNYIMNNKIQHVMFLSGDAHCQNDAMFNVIKADGQPSEYSFLEVLVSGLFAVSRGKADKLTGQVDSKEGGQQLQLKAEIPLAPTLKENLFARISGNHQTKEVTIQVYDDQNNLLKEKKYQL